MSEDFGKILVTYNPLTVDQDIRGSMVSKKTETAYFRLIKCLAEKGAELDFFQEEDFDFLLNEDSHSVEEYLFDRLDGCSFIFHHVDEFNSSLMTTAFSRDRMRFIELAMLFLNNNHQVTTDSERILNTFIYEGFGDISHGCYVPSDYQFENIRRKDMLPNIAKRLDVPSPVTFPASSFHGDFYPAVLKKSISKCGRDVHLLKNESDFFGMKRGLDLDDYVVQEMVNIPSDTAAAFRAVCFGDKLLGIVLYMSDDELVSNRENRLVYICKNPEDEIPLMVSSSRKISVYCSSRSCQKIGIDFVVDKEGNHYCLDVNRDPGTGFYHVMFGEDRKYSGITSGLQLSAEIDSDIILKKIRD